MSGGRAVIRNDDRLREAGRARATEVTWARTAELTIAAYEEAVGG